jgi:hypothetical protein
MRKLMSTSSGRIGVLLLCALLVGLLGGVAFGAPDTHTNGPPTISPSNERSDSQEAPERGGEDQGDAQAPAHTAADCSAGLSDVQTSLPPVDRATGLAHAIQVVEGNCEKNLQAPGLVVALSHLVTNYQRHLAHEEDKAAGVHGNSAAHGHAAAHGRSGQHGS